MLTFCTQPPDAFTGSKKSSLFLTASFGCLVPRSILSLYDQGHALNVHPSLLPRYRGAAPIQWTIANGDRESGVTVQELSIDKFDHGRVLAQQKAVSKPFTTSFHVALADASKAC